MYLNWWFCGLGRQGELIFELEIIIGFNLYSVPLSIQDSDSELLYL